MRALIWPYIQVIGKDALVHYVFVQYRTRCPVSDGRRSTEISEAVVTCLWCVAEAAR